MSDGITTATDFLRDAVRGYLAEVYDHPSIKTDVEIDGALGWVPTLNCAINNHLMLVEASEKVYPAIFRMRRAEMGEVEKPIAVYCACPEEAYLDDQKAAQELARHGFGLFTVDAQGQVTKKFPAIPIAQHINETDFRSDVKGLPPKVKREVQVCYETYKGNSPSGVASLSEIVEGMIMKAAKEAVKKGWMANADASGPLASVLAKMKAAPQFSSANAKLSGAEAFVSRYRNTSHHFPKNQKQAHRKYRDCRHGFLEGVRILQDLRDAFKASGLAGSI